jgi:hypothetical protein
MAQPCEKCSSALQSTELPGEDGTTTTDLTLGAEQLRLSTWETVMALFKDALWYAVLSGPKRGSDPVPGCTADLLHPDI